MELDPAVIIDSDFDNHRAQVPAKPASVIWMHGLGADGHDFEPIVDELELPPRPVRVAVHDPSGAASDEVTVTFARESHEFERSSTIQATAVGLTDPPMAISPPPTSPRAVTPADGKVHA